MVSAVETVSVTYRQAITMALTEALEEDPRVFLLGEDIQDPAGGIQHVTQGLSTKFGEHRVRATPISETAIIGASIGAALAGMRPIPEIMQMDFLGVCMDQIVNHAAKLSFTSDGRTPCPLTVRVSSFTGMTGGATHSQSFESWLLHVPGLKVVMPSTAYDAKGLLRTCILDPDPCIFIEVGQQLPVKGEVPPAPYTIDLGVADVKREGADITVVAYGNSVIHALKAADRLSEDGISVEVVDLRSLMPLDMDTVLRSVGKTKRLVVAHMATRLLGIGAEIAARVGEELFGELASPIGRVGARYAPIGSARALEQAALPGPDEIEAAIRKAVTSR
jgi:pyruvate dehydrogenase E1 component beta subunit